MPGQRRFARRDEPRVSKEGLPSTMLDEIRRIETASATTKVDRTSGVTGRAHESDTKVLLETQNTRAQRTQNCYTTVVQQSQTWDIYMSVTVCVIRKRFRPLNACKLYTTPRVEADSMHAHIMSIRSTPPHVHDSKSKDVY